MLKTIRSIPRKFLCGLGRTAVSPQIFRMARRPEGPEIPVSVHMLVSSKTWHAGVLAFISFELHTGRRWPLYLHEDGSVSAAARAEIERILPGIRFVPRAEANEKVAAYLSDHPACLRHRGNHNLFLKFFDIPAFAPFDRFISLDSDVIFFQKPQEILDWALTNAETCHYNEDTKEKYCIPRPYIEEALQISLWHRFNSGLVLMQARAIDKDLAEKLLVTFEETAHHPQFFEQTLYGLMCSAYNKGGPLPRTYNISWGYFADPGSICRHYVGDFKHDLLYFEGAPRLAAALLTHRLRHT